MLKRMLSKTWIILIILVIAVAVKNKLDYDAERLRLQESIVSYQDKVTKLEQQKADLQAENEMLKKELSKPKLIIKKTPEILYKVMTPDDKNAGAQRGVNDEENSN